MTSEGAAPALPSGGRVLVSVALVTALVTALSWLLPARFAATGVGLGFLGATWWLVLRGDPNEVPLHGLSLGGLFERERLVPARLLRDGGLALLFAIVVSLVIFPPFVIGYKIWWGRAVGHPLVWSSAKVVTRGMLDDALGQILVIALPEEAFFRGYLQTELDRVWRPRFRLMGALVGPSLIVTSAIFAVGHVLTQPDPSRLAVFFPSLLFGWMRARAGGIGAPVLLHATCNLFVSVLAHGFGLARGLGPRHAISLPLASRSRFPSCMLRSQCRKQRWRVRGHDQHRDDGRLAVHRDRDDVLRPRDRHVHGAEPADVGRMHIDRRAGVLRRRRLRDDGDQHRRRDPEMPRRHHRDGVRRVQRRVERSLPHELPRRRPRRPLTPMPRAALFDLDRTLVRVETASLYVRYQREIGEATWKDSARVAYWVAQYTLGILDAPKVAVKALSTLAGMHETVMSARCDDWVRRSVAKHVADGGREAVREHREAGDVLAIVTGASPYVAKPVARMLGIEHVVSSELEMDEKGVFTGRPVFPLCYGEGKITRAKKLAEELDFRLEDAAFYTDSYTDLPLLLAVGEPIIVNPDTRLRREAVRRKWRILTW